MTLLGMLTESNVGIEMNANGDELVTEANSIYLEFSEVIKEHIMHNLEDFIVVGDVQATYENIQQFAESSSITMMNNLHSMLEGNDPFELN